MRKAQLTDALALALLAAAASPSLAETHPRDAEIRDADTRAWWHITESLSNDGMGGRDTGSPAYQRAADYVAASFKAAGLEPAGEGGGYFQSVPMHEIAVAEENTSFSLLRADGSQQALDFLQQITVAPSAAMPAQLEAPLAFRGYCGKESMAGARGKIVTQPIDFGAAAKFNRFFYDLVETIASRSARPTLYPSSPFATKN
jgi:hypothetical protein